MNSCIHTYKNMLYSLLNPRNYYYHLQYDYSFSSPLQALYGAAWPYLAIINQYSIPQQY